MKILVCLTFASLLFAGAAVAADGRYSGRGVIQVEGRSSVACSRVSLDVQDDSWNFVIRQFEFDCDENIRGSMEERRFDVRGRDLYLNGERVGTRNPGETEITIRDNSSGTVLGLRFRDQYYDAVDVIQEFAAPNFNQRLTASLRRY